MKNWNIIKNGQIVNLYTMDTSKPGNFNNLIGNFYYETVTLKLIQEESQCQNRVLWLFFASLA